MPHPTFEAQPNVDAGGSNRRFDEKNHGSHKDTAVKEHLRGAKIDWVSGHLLSSDGGKDIRQIVFEVFEEEDGQSD